MERYKVVTGSQSCHCCFSATIVDTTKPLEKYEGFENLPEFDSVCECFDMETAEALCKSLNEDGQKIYEAGLLAIADTAKKAFLEGFRMAASPEYYIDPSDPDSAWLTSDVCVAVTKAVEAYAGRKL